MNKIPPPKKKKKKKTKKRKEETVTLDKDMENASREAMIGR